MLPDFLIKEICVEKRHISFFVNINLIIISQRMIYTLEDLI